MWLSAKGKKIKANAVLDDASTVSYVNKEVAGALGRLSATYEKVTVNVLNENVETFASMPVSLFPESCDGNVKVPFKALTCPPRVTGSYKIVDWQKYQDRWPHLRGSDCKYRESAEKLRKSKILITCRKNTFGELSSKILLKPSGILLFSGNSEKMVLLNLLCNNQA